MTEVNVHTKEYIPKSRKEIPKGGITVIGLHIGDRPTIKCMSL